MGVFTTVKSTSSVGLYFKRQATQLAEHVARAGGRLNRVFDLFLLRAVGNLKRKDGRTTIVEVPPVLLGGFGGKNGSSPLYTPVVAVSFGAAVDDLARKTMRLDPATGAYLPHKDDSAFTISCPLGDGRVSVGAPDWSVPRNALNDTTGAYAICPTAVVVAVCPTIDGGAKSLLVCRAAPAMVPGLKVDWYGLPLPGQDYVPPDGFPAMPGGVPKGSAARLSGVEFGSAELVSGHDEVLTAGPCLEWTPLHGMVSYGITQRDGSGTETGKAVGFLRYGITAAVDPAGGNTYTGGILSNTVIDGAALPAGEQPETVSAFTAARTAGYTYTGASWPAAYTAINDRVASPGKLTLPRDISEASRIWGAGLGDPTRVAGRDALAIVEVAVTTDSTAMVSVTGYQVGGGGWLYDTIAVAGNAGRRHLTYVVSLPETGGSTLRKISDFVDERYATGGALERYTWQAYGGVALRTGEPRLFAVRRKIQYEVLPAGADVPETVLSPAIQGEPARRVPVAGYYYVQPSDLTAFLVSDSGEVELALGDYFPALGSLNTSEVGSGSYPPGRYGFGDTALRPASPKYGNDFPVPFCQYAPGKMILMVHPVSSFTSDTWPIVFKIIDVATGGVLQTINTGLSTAYNARLTLTCMEQAAVDVGGSIVAHGTLMLSVSTTLSDEGRRDGIYLIHSMATVSWFAREPSNVAAVYAGNALCPATLGVSANMLSMPSPKPPST